MPPGTATDALKLLMASESLAEALRRSVAALALAGRTTSADDLLATVSCAISGGDPETAASPQAIAAFHVAAFHTLLEAAQARLAITEHGVDAVPILEASVSSVFGFHDNITAAALPINEPLLEQLLRGAHAALAAVKVHDLFELYTQLYMLPADSTRPEQRAELMPLAIDLELANLLGQAASEQEVANAFQQAFMAHTIHSAPPEIDIIATPQTLNARGTESITLAYNANHANACQRVGTDFSSWSGVWEPEAILQLGPIERNETLFLHCVGSGGIAEANIEVIVPPEIHIEFIAEDGSTVDDFITLADTVAVEFSVLDADDEQCQARRSDTNELITAGAPITAAPGIAITMTCETAGGQTAVRRTLPVRAARLSWRAPTEREDGSPLTDLAGFRIYHGAESGIYESQFIAIDSPSVTDHTQAFPPGPRYFVVTSVSASGEESRYSMEVFQQIP
ncbi:MAG: hypothetical protein EA417_05625 [Gammaproteobacteria bacterium]|nr:MAG: hypothetical protein EA417_05625 [Gammaproteobacteria bacterium]